MMAIQRLNPEPCPFIGQLCEYVPMANRMVKLEEEIKLLQEALKKIVYIDWKFKNNETIERVEGPCAKIARAALKEGE